MAKGLRVYVNAAYAEKIKPSLNNVIPPWDKAMFFSKLWALDFPEKPTEGELAAVLNNLKAWDIALNWLINLEWDSNYKISPKPTLTKALESRGLFLQSLFRLCERCKSFDENIPPEILPYGNAAQLFNLVFEEHRQASVSAVFNRNSELKDKNLDKKEAVLHSRREACQMLRDFQNPETDHPCNQASYRLMEAAICLARQSNRFYDNFYMPFVRAISAETTDMDNPNYGRLILESGKAFIKTGRGRAKKPLKHPNIF